MAGRVESECCSSIKYWFLQMSREFATDDVPRCRKWSGRWLRRRIAQYIGADGAGCCEDARLFKIRGNACDRRRTRSRGCKPNLAANARRAPVPNSAWSCSLKIGTWISVASQERAIAPRPSCSMRLTMPLTAPCRCTNSITAAQNASLLDCSQKEVRLVECFMSVVPKLKRV